MELNESMRRSVVLETPWKVSFVCEEEGKLMDE